MNDISLQQRFASVDHICASFSTNRRNHGGSRPGSGRKPIDKILTIPPIPAGVRWFAAECERGMIHTANRSVIEFGFNTYIPTQLIKIREKISGRRVGKYTNILRPIFYNFLFIEFDPSVDFWQQIKSTDGIRKLLLTSAGRPAPVERGFIENLKETEDDRLKLPDVRLPKLAQGTQALVVRGADALVGRVVEVLRCDGITTQVMVVGLLGGAKMLIKRADLTVE
jgi:transcription antitermination factor NusG